MPTIKNSGIIHVSGKCFDCEEIWEGATTAMRATQHHQETGHKIRVEQHLFWERSVAPNTQPTQLKKRKSRKRRKK